MPIGIAGLLVAAILAAAMSNLSAALNSLSSTTVVDFYMHLRPDADDRERVIISEVLHRALGARPLRHRGLQRAGRRQRPRRRDRPLHRLRRLRLPARRLPARHAHALRHGTRRHHRHDLRLHSQRLALARSIPRASRSRHHPAHRLDLVRPHRSGCDLPHRRVRQPRPRQAHAHQARRRCDSAVCCCLSCFPSRGAAQKPTHHQASAQGPATVSLPDFTAVSALINDAIAEHSSPAQSSSSATAAESSSSRPTATASSPVNPASTASPHPPSP